MKRSIPLLVSTMLAAPMAYAATPTVIELSPGIGGPQGERGGPGNEQASVASVVQGGKQYLVTVYMNSDVPSADTPWQCKCSSVLLDPTAGPTLAADKIQLTHLQGDRPCNHPKLASDGANLLWTYGSNDPNQDTVATYAQAIDASCNLLSTPLLISANRNNNEGAPDILANGGGLWTAGYLSQGNNEATYAVGLKAVSNGGTGPGSVSLTQTYRTVVVSPSNIGRPTMLASAPNRTLVCAAQGNERPPEDGVACTLIDATAGTVLWNQIIAASDPGNSIYMNQPQLAAVDGTKVALLVTESSGGGRNRFRPKATMNHLYTLAPTDGGPGLAGVTDAVGAFQNHGTLCAGQLGSDGVRKVGIYEAPITGNGLAQMVMTSLGPAGKMGGSGETVVVNGNNADSGYLSNIYGQNPYQQGRDFLRCIGDVANPGYGVAGGFRPNVKTFFAMVNGGNKPGEPKNALFLTLHPGAVDPSAPPTPGPTATPGGPGEGGGPGNGSAQGGSVWGCEVGGSGGGGLAAGLLLGVLGLLALRRRRAAFLAASLALAACTPSVSEGPGGGGGGPTPAPGSSPGTGSMSLSQALTRFGQCMSMTEWNSAGMPDLANQSTTMGPCYSCHSQGMSASWLSVDNNNAFFTSNQSYPYELKIVVGTVDANGNFADLVPAWRWRDKGQEGGTHPQFILSDTRLQALTTWVNQTLTRYHDPTINCPAGVP